MLHIILSGCNGRMGKVITDLAREDQDLQIVAGIDVAGENSGNYPVFKTTAECDVTADAVIDFSSPLAFDALMDYCCERSLPVVVCTTGLSETQLARLQAESARIPVLRSANMSLGVNVLMKLAAAAAGVLAAAGFDMEIVERHHNKKKDAPSGTAISLAEEINSAAGGDYSFVYDRSGRFEQRGAKEIGVSAVRGGTIVGDHEVIFAGTDEVIEIRHSAYSRSIFGKGALQAAKFLAGMEPGYYSMRDVIG